MIPVLRAFLACSLVLVFLGCFDSSSGPAGLKQSSRPPTKDEREQARKVLSDYFDRYEEVYFQHGGQDRLMRLEQVKDEYDKRMAQLMEKGEWTPLRELGTFLKLSFLMGQFHGAVQSCKIERIRKEKTKIGCDEIIERKEAMLELCTK
jgi:hypothetical protein